MLSDFYKDLYGWVDSHFLTHPFFSIKKGICWSLDSWMAHHGVIFNSQRWHSLRGELTSQFLDAGLDIDYPFNEGQRYMFVAEENSNGLWCNPERLQWVKDHAK